LLQLSYHAIPEFHVYIITLAHTANHG